MHIIEKEMLAAKERANIGAGHEGETFRKLCETLRAGEQNHQIVRSACILRRVQGLVNTLGVATYLKSHCRKACWFKLCQFKRW